MVFEGSDLALDNRGLELKVNNSASTLLPTKSLMETIGSVCFSSRLFDLVMCTGTRLLLFIDQNGALEEIDLGILGTNRCGAFSLRH